MTFKRDFLLLLVFGCLLVYQAQALSPICEVCHEMVGSFEKSIPIAPFDILLSAIGLQYCQKKHIQDKTVCKGAITEMIGPIINSIWKKQVNPHELCHKLYLCPKQYFKRNITAQLENIVKNKPDRQWEKATGRKNIRIMHISDLHPDFFYTVGSEAKCDQPICCRAANTTSEKSLREQVALGAGYWGSISKCDLPLQTFDLFLGEIKKLSLDFMIWTGDNTAHDIWAQSQSYNINFTTYLTTKIRETTNVTVLPAMGNHQSYPVNVYDYQGQRQNMLKQALAQNWKSWIGQNAYQMLKTKGYYSIQLPQFNNLKIISINTQAGNDGNFFLLKNPTDPGQMLQWMFNELLKSQSSNQIVYIIGHIPPNNNMNSWALRYNAIIDRFSYTVRGQFYGHTHNDHIGAHYSLKNESKLVNYYFVAPSLTTYDFRIPRYRVLDVDYDTLQVKDFQQYRLDLRKYQKISDNPKFQLLYSFKQAYGITDMRPQSGITAMLQKLKTDTAIQTKYNYFHNGGIQAGKPGIGWYCDTFALPQMASKCNGQIYKPGFVEKFGGQWKDLKHKD